MLVIYHQMSRLYDVIIHGSRRDKTDFGFSDKTTLKPDFSASETGYKN